MLEVLPIRRPSSHSTIDRRPPDAQIPAFCSLPTSQRQGQGYGAVVSNLWRFLCAIAWVGQHSVRPVAVRRAECRIVLRLVSWTADDHAALKWWWISARHG